MRLRRDAQIGSPSMSAASRIRSAISQAAPESPTSGRRKDKSPRVAHGPGAGIGGRVGGELAVELADKRDTVGKPQLSAGGGERGILHGCRAVADEARAANVLEHGG